MGRYSLAALVGAAFLLPLSAGAWAADLPEIPPAYSPPVEVGGSWYLRGDIGMTNQAVGSLYNALYDVSTTSVDNISKNFESSPLFGLGIGYRHNDHLRFDLTGEFRGNATFHGLDVYTDSSTDPATLGTDEYTAVKTEWTFLANAYWDIGTWHGITPFIGAGIGPSYNTIKGFTDVNTVTNGVAYGAEHSQWSLAWQLTAGLSYQATPNLTVEAAYRYIDLGSAASGDIIAYDGTNDVYNPMEFRHLTSQDFKVGLRYAFDVPQDYGPAVVKY
jgi:opacity protein-like surface antigen